MVHAYCLMPNHFHLMLETPSGNLSRMMHFIITIYTIYFNKKYDRHGHLFQGRFHSVLVEAESYAKELSRYIHLNPVRSEIVDRPERFPWSSYGYYRGAGIPERWLETSVILKLFGDSQRAAERAYVEYVARGIGVDPPASIKGAERKGILGSEEFIARIKKEYLGEQESRPDREKPQLRQLRKTPDLGWILSVAKRNLGPRNRYLVPLTIMVSHKCTSLKLGEIGLFFSLSVSGVSNASSRAKAMIAKNAPLARAMKEIAREIEERDGQP